MIKKDVKLYNMILPPFMLFAFVPIFWLISLVGNFIIDSIVLLIISLIIFKKVDWKFYKKVILKVWAFGFIGDIIGVAYLVLVSTLSNATFYNGNDLGKQIMSGIYLATSQSHFDSIWGVLFIVSGILVAAVFIFLFDLIAFINTGLSKKQKILSALSYAVFTAPYLFLIPKSLLY